MRFLVVCLILTVETAVGDNSVKKEFIDLSNPDDNVLLWQTLFAKLNGLVSEMEQQMQSFKDLKQSLYEITQRQERQESRMAKLMESGLEQRLEHISRFDQVQRRLDELDKKLDNQNSRQQLQDGIMANMSSNIQKWQNEHFNSQSWTTVLRRQNGFVNFYRNWTDYRNGFGNPDADFFLGLERMHQLTSSGIPYELLIVLTDFGNETRFARYDNFRIANESEHYSLVELGQYSGDAGNSMASHKGQPFSTLDKNNNFDKGRKCPQLYKGGWWFGNPCYTGYLNGIYRKEIDSNSSGISWQKFRGWNVSLKYAAMMIRPRLRDMS